MRLAMRFAVPGICVATLLLFASAAGAQVGKLGLGIHGSSVGSATEEDARQMQWGLHARARLSNFIGLEGSVDYRSEDVNGATVALYPIQVSGLFYLLPSSRLQVYALLGLGWTWTTVDGELVNGDAESTDFGYHWGFGAEVPFGAGSAVYVDVRYLNLDLDISSIIMPDVETEDWQLSFGYTFYF